MSRYSRPVCYGCGHTGHKRNVCPSSNRHRSDPPAILAVARRAGDCDVSIFSLMLDGWWGNRSAFVSRDCDVARLKRTFIDTLLDQGLVSNTDMDARNQIAHVELRRDPQDATGTGIYDRIHGSTVSLSFARIRFHKDFIDVDVGFDKHVTLVFKRGLCDTQSKVELIADVLEYCFNHIKSVIH